MARLIALVVLLASGAALAADRQPPQRARPPKWDRAVLDVFFEDAREQLIGERPSPEPAGRETAAGAGERDESAADDFRWSTLIDGETLATEVKRIANSLAAPLANPSQFKSGGFQQCRRDFGLLAVLFAVIAEHDQPVRWHDPAATLRDAFARASGNCKAASDQSFAEATARRTDLDDVVRGQRLAEAESAPLDQWSSLADRTLLMQRMETALEGRISPAVANAAAFKRQADDVRHEAEILAMLAEVMQREAYDYWDDDDFAAMADDLRRAAVDLSEAADSGNYDRARTAVGAATKSCSNCHEGYRG